SGSVVLTNDFVLTGGTLTGSGSILAGDTNHTAKLRAQGSTTFNFTGSVDNVELLGNGVVTLAADLNVARGFTLTDANQINSSTTTLRKINVTGNLTSADTTSYSISGSQ